MGMLPVSCSTHEYRARIMMHGELIDSLLAFSISRSSVWGFQKSSVANFTSHKRWIIMIWQTFALIPKAVNIKASRKLCTVAAPSEGRHYQTRVL